MKKCPTCGFTNYHGMGVNFHIGEKAMNPGIQNIEDICPVCFYNWVHKNFPVMEEYVEKTIQTGEVPEFVSVIDDTHLPYIFGNLNFEGGFNGGRKIIRRAKHIIETTSNYMERKLAEQNPSFKQVIPYVVLRSPYGVQVLGYKRTKKSGEGRLAEKWSVGIGGHINPVDGAGLESVTNCIERELFEEFDLVLDQLGARSTLGIIYDPSDDVGKVHFGVVYQYRVPERVLKTIEDNSGDPSIGERRFMTPAEALTMPNMENWSQLVLKGVKWS